MIRGRGDSRRGLTIIEVLVSMALTVIIAAVGYRFYIMAKTVWLYTYEQGNLEGTAMIGLERIIHGVERDAEAIDGAQFNVAKGLIEAQDITTPPLGNTSNQIVFVDPQGATRSFSKIDDRLVYTDDAGSARDIIGGDVNTLLVSRDPADVGAADDVVYLRLILRKNVLDRQFEGQAETSVQPRNM